MRSTRTDSCAGARARRGAIRASARIDAAGRIAIGSRDDVLRVFTADGALLRGYNLGQDIDGAAALAADGTVYIAPIAVRCTRFASRLHDVPKSESPADSKAHARVLKALRRRKQRALHASEVRGRIGWDRTRQADICNCSISSLIRDWSRSYRVSAIKRCPKWRTSLPSDPRMA